MVGIDRDLLSLMQGFNGQEEVEMLRLTKRKGLRQKKGKMDMTYKSLRVVVYPFRDVFFLRKVNSRDRLRIVSLMEGFNGQGYISVQGS